MNLSETPQATNPPASAAAGKSLLHRLSATPVEVPAAGNPATPTESFHRPRPLPKHQDTSSGWVGHLTEKVKQWQQSAGAGGKPDAKRQRLMAILVGVLTVVFIGVLYISFGGVGQSGAKKVPLGPAAANAASAPAAMEPQQWAFPKALPEQMRNPMRPAPIGYADTPNGLIVRGIVHSKTKPTAIVNNQIVEIGQVIFGVKITNITPTTVEFEKDGQRWTQGVQ